MQINMYDSLKKSRIPLKNTFFIRVCRIYSKNLELIHALAAVVTIAHSTGGPKKNKINEPKFLSEKSEEYPSNWKLSLKGSESSIPK